MQRSGSSMVPMANLAPPNSPAQPNNPAQAGNTAQPTSTTQQNKPARAEKRKRRTGNLLWMALPRVALALLLGVVISTPIVLRIFQSEIKTQISIIKDNNEVNFLNSQQHSAIQARINTWQPIVTNLQGVITSNGAKPLNPDSDPVVQGLTIQLTNEQSVAATDYEAWQCQLYGGCGAPKGSGPLAAASEKRYDADETQIASLTTQIQEREQALQAASATSQAARLGQAKSALPNAQAQLKAAQTEEDALLSNFQSANGATNGLLIRLQALDQLTAGSGDLQAARWALFLLFAMFELLPVLTKIFQSIGEPTSYERGLTKVDEERYDALTAPLTDAERMESAKSTAWANVRPQVVTQYGTAYLATAWTRAPAGGSPAQGRRARWPRRPRLRPYDAVPVAGHPVPPVTGNFLQQYVPAAATGPHNGHAPGSGP